MKKKGLLIIKSESPISRTFFDMLHEQIKPICERLEVEGLILDSGLEAGLSYDLSPLVSAIQSQTEAIIAMVESNHQLIQAMAETDEGTEPTRATYLDGKPKT